MVKSGIPPRGAGKGPGWGWVGGRAGGLVGGWWKGGGGEHLARKAKEVQQISNRLSCQFGTVFICADLKQIYNRFEQNFHNGHVFVLRHVTFIEL